MSEFVTRARQLTPEIFESFKRAIETGRWSDGKPLSDKQRELVTQSIIIFEHDNVGKTDRVGEIADQCASKRESDNNDHQTLTIK